MHGSAAGPATVAWLAAVMLVACGAFQDASAATHAPTLATVEWSMVNADTARFHLRWTNPDADTASEPTSGTLTSQEFAAFAGDYLTIGTFDVPAMAPGGFLDLYFDKARERAAARADQRRSPTAGRRRAGPARRTRSGRAASTCAGTAWG